jgi:predicted nucleic acid-binding protein
MIYLDTSVALAHLLAEDRHPPDELWTEVLVSSRLIEYELWTRLHARGLASSHGAASRSLLARLAMLELSPTVLTRALEPFPVPVRTLDALHLASADFLRDQKQAVEMASYDDRFLSAARKMGFPISRHCSPVQL